MSRIADGLLLLAAVALAFWMGSLLGQAKGGAEQQLVADQRERSVSEQHAAALATANARNRAAEASLRIDLAKQAKNFKRALDDEKAHKDSLLYGLRYGAVRLSVPVLGTSTGQACGAHANGDPGATGGDWHEARAELAPQAAADLVSIAHEGNAAIHQLNACIDRYNAVRARFNALLPAHAQAQ
ncbi:lysis system i-spanin subunit Rz [Pelomonas sp. BJYL3]|uniref:lysis system i-spanin subunit Rz n=1 Tax=Pelomonas sp. BJYL3 TaxID=2976697 RepID=UPI0022B4C927|nr:lysis system i-spanin subunit Rz [Pelomonas sp. BJYL3]